MRPPPRSWKGPRPRPHPAPKSGQGPSPSCLSAAKQPRWAGCSPQASPLPNQGVCPGWRCKEPLSASASDRSLLGSLRCPQSASHMAGARGCGLALPGPRAPPTPLFLLQGLGWGRVSPKPPRPPGLGARLERPAGHAQESLSPPPHPPRRALQSGLTLLTDTVTPRTAAGPRLVPKRPCTLSCAFHRST